MVAGKKPYPKATLKKIVKAHSGMSVRKNTDITVWSYLGATTRFSVEKEGKTQNGSADCGCKIYLNYVLFMNRLIKEAAIHAKQSGERGLTARSVRKATRDALAKFKG